MDLLVQAIQTGVEDRSISAELAREPRLLGMSLWAFTHGIVQITIAKAGDLAQQGIPAPVFTDYAFELVRTLLRSSVA
jgi:hypothetical protein